MPSSAAPTSQPESPKVRSDPTKLLWLDEDYRVVLDERTLSALTDAERAAVGYVATSLGSDCDWAAGEGAEPGDHLDCKLTSALGLGYQCEEKHKTFLLQWLGEAIPALCARVPISATSQRVLKELSIDTKGARITITFEAVGTAGPGAKTSAWSETLHFQVQGQHQLKLARRQTKGKPFSP